jgi:hypothetical protein
VGLAVSVAAVKAGGVYMAAVFVVAFLLGTVRVLFLAPLVGPVIAVLVEAPVILTVSWLVSRWCCGLFDLRGDVAACALMGAAAFVMLMLVELGVATLLFGTSVAAYLESFLSAAGVIGLVAQAGFAAIPAIQARRS